MACKICGSGRLTIRAHTAKCASCGALLYWPYPTEFAVMDGASSPAWYAKAARRNHDNFTRMLQFALQESDYERELSVLDYGGGGGQFAMVCRSMLPLSEVSIVDVADDGLLDIYRPNQRQIPWRSFVTDDAKFDLIMLNDVYEHVDDPIGVLKVLRTKLRSGGKLFIDTPKQFWIYPLLRIANGKLYEKLLRGTVSTAHLQIWSRESFRRSVALAGMRIAKYREISEFTMAPEFYLKNMGIANPVTAGLANLFYRMAKWVSANKILAVVEPA